MRIERYLLCLLVALLGGGCEESLRGKGTIFLWNGGEEPIELRVEGPSPVSVSLAKEQGRLLTESVAGTYQITALKAGKLQGTTALELERDKLTIFNMDGLGCFGRADVSGMYTRGKQPVRLLQRYQDETVITIADDVGALPGEPLPTKRPKSDYGFQRVAVVPCDLIQTLGSDFPIEEYIRKLR